MIVPRRRWTQWTAGTKRAFSGVSAAVVQAGEGTSKLKATVKRHVISASTLSGYRVRDTAHQDLGTIEELMLDPLTGCIAYAVLSFGGFLGFGDRLFAIPWSMLSLNADEKALILTVDRDMLAAAPGFGQDEWPDLADDTWHSRIHSYYGLQPAYT